MQTYSPIADQQAVVKVEAVVHTLQSLPELKSQQHLELGLEQNQAVVEPVTQPGQDNTAAAVRIPSKKGSGSLWKVFASTFLTILLAELGDKTQVATLLMAAESHAPWIIFSGAAAALITTSLLGVWVGCWLAKRISPKTLDTAAGITLTCLSVWMFWEGIQL